MKDFEHLFSPIGWKKWILLATMVAAALGANAQERGEWSLKTNLLYDAILMPSLEIEYRFHPRWSLNLEGDMAWWKKDSRHKYYQLATISPEIRWWFKQKERRQGHYAGFFIDLWISKSKLSLLP